MPSSTSNSPIHGASRAGGCLATSSGFSDICKTKAMVSSTARSVTNRVEVSANLSTYFFNVVSEFSSFKLIKKKLLRLFHMQVPGGGGGGGAVNNETCLFYSSIVYHDNTNPWKELNILSLLYKRNQCF